MNTAEKNIGAFDSVFRNNKKGIRGRAKQPLEKDMSINLIYQTQIVNRESSVVIFNCMKCSMSLLHFVDKRSEPYSVRPRLFLVTEETKD